MSEAKPRLVVEPEMLTLRDYFAGQALAGLMSLGMDAEPYWKNKQADRDMAADWAYAQADAMLKERSK